MTMIIEAKSLPSTCLGRQQLLVLDVGDLDTSEGSDDGAERGKAQETHHIFQNSPGGPKEVKNYDDKSKFFTFCIYLEKQQLIVLNIGELEVSEG